MNSPNSENSKTSHRISILVALITLFGVLATALVSYINGRSSDSNKQTASNPIIVNNNNVNNNINNNRESSSEKIANRNENNLASCIDRNDRGGRPIKPSKQQLTTALVFMSFSGREDCIDALLNAGADINGAGSDTNFKGPALHISITQKNWDIAIRLLEGGANPNLTYQTGTGRYNALQLSKLGDAPEYFIDVLKKMARNRLGDFRAASRPVQNSALAILITHKL